MTGQSLFDFSNTNPDMFFVTTGTLSKEYILFGQKPKDCKKYTLSFTEQNDAELYLIKRYGLTPLQAKTATNTALSKKGEFTAFYEYDEMYIF